MQKTFHTLVEQALFEAESLDARIARILRQGFEPIKQKKSATSKGTTKPKGNNAGTTPRQTQIGDPGKQVQDAQGRLNIDKFTGMNEFMAKHTPQNEIYVWGAKDSKPTWSGFNKAQVFTRDEALEMFKPRWQKYAAGSASDFEEYVDSMLEQLKTADQYQWYTA